MARQEEGDLLLQKENDECIRPQTNRDGLEKALGRSQKRSGCTAEAEV
jgi:hypothetical protein